MKKLLLASTALVMTAGVAAADVRVGGDGRMGIVKTLTSDDLAFTSRIRISFAASGETDGGLTFGGSIRADNSGGISVTDDDNDGELDTVTNGGGVNGVAGSVFISGAFGRLTMGDVSGAPEAAVGDVSGVGLTGLGDLNEASYLSNGGRPAMRYDYTTGAFGVHISADNPTLDDVYGIAVSYNGGGYKFGLGYETDNDLDASHIIAGGSASFGDATLKAFYGVADAGGDSFNQYGLSVDYSLDALTLTVFYTSNEIAPALDGRTTTRDAYGIGAAYDLGGGASLKGGYAKNDETGDDAYDFGIALTF